MLVLAGLGFSSGLPSASKLLGSTLAAWALAVGAKVETVTDLALVTLPVGLKVLWAPLLDRFELPFLGRRRGWLLVFQVACAAGVAGMAIVGPTDAASPLAPLAVAAVFVAFASASQDVVADAYRADVLAPPERGAGAAMFVNGYRVALLVAGWGALALAEEVSWRAVYLVLAATMAVGAVATLAAREPEEAARRPTTLGEAVVRPWTELASRLGRAFGVVVAFIALFKVPDAMAAVMTMPLLLRELGFGLAEVGLLRDVLTLVFAVAGALVGGPLVARWGLRRSLLLFGVLQAASNLGFCALATAGKSLPLLAGVVAVESLCQGLSTAGFLAYLMSLCDRRYSATQFALFTGIMHLVGSVVGSRTGLLLGAVGYAPAFALSALAGLPALALLPWLPFPARDEAPPPEAAPD
jgi:PAT family beta-lactamase induction signal transducer AmpG